MADKPLQFSAPSMSEKIDDSMLEDLEQRVDIPERSQAKVWDDVFQALTENGKKIDELMALVVGSRSSSIRPQTEPQVFVTPKTETPFVTGLHNEVGDSGVVGDSFLMADDDFEKQSVVENDVVDVNCDLNLDVVYCAADIAADKVFDEIPMRTGGFVNETFDGQLSNLIIEDAFADVSGNLDVALGDNLVARDEIERDNDQYVEKENSGKDGYQVFDEMLEGKSGPDYQFDVEFHKCVASVNCLSENHASFPSELLARDDQYKFDVMFDPGGIGMLVSKKVHEPFPFRIKAGGNMLANAFEATDMWGFLHQSSVYGEVYQWIRMECEGSTSTPFCSMLCQSVCLDCISFVWILPHEMLIFDPGGEVSLPALKCPLIQVAVLINLGDMGRYRWLQYFGVYDLKLQYFGATGHSHPWSCLFAIFMLDVNLEDKVLFEERYVFDRGKIGILRLGCDGILRHENVLITHTHGKLHLAKPCAVPMRVWFDPEGGLLRGDFLRHGSILLLGSAAFGWKNTDGCLLENMTVYGLLSLAFMVPGSIWLLLCIQFWKDIILLHCRLISVIALGTCVELKPKPGSGAMGNLNFESGDEHGVVQSVILVALQNMQRELMMPIQLGNFYTHVKESGFRTTKEYG